MLVEVRFGVSVASSCTYTTARESCSASWRLNNGPGNSDSLHDSRVCSQVNGHVSWNNVQWQADTATPRRVLYTVLLVTTGSAPKLNPATRIDAF